MLSFKTLTLEDKPWIDEIVKSEQSRSADFCFGNLYIWDKQYRQLVTKSGGRMITKIRIDMKPSFAFPIGEGELEPVILEMKEYTDQSGFPLIIHGVEEKNGRLLEEIFPGRFKYELMDKLCDYVYPVENLSTYTGKALHGKKNHCNHFEKEFPDYEQNKYVKAMPVKLKAIFSLILKRNWNMLNSLLRANNLIKGK